ncbi:ACP S-malonyltransferase [Fretibacterium sp. OH1220_COT-178]|uniref:ACP S-malonyltransferase n=1 Tax=Fretibacterium sp. OH1220_COT-178 TaxID=2491047 RepID=UPI000F5F69E6|nr:ACP S-malonyltransferase [Fretibacterium sp. OH1220_COT-178]RRD64685.1 [acyl-carrier-protein] S-malonyltransferase [Fretibacterium sp. OH1220_COT-178]
MKYALCFPGQGAQEVGMGRALYESFPSAKAVFDEADDALSMHLTKLIFEGPDEVLKLTANTQPAIMTTSVAALRVLEGEMGAELAPACGAGHSLGEYTALVASGVLAFRDAVDLVNKRGRWMQESAPEGVGAMAAVMGLEPDDIVAVCREVAPNEECQAANFNSPGQVVISGVAEYVDKAVAAAKARGARKAVMLNVSAPFHSRLMMPAAEKLKAQFETYSWSDPRWPIVANVSARPVSTAADIKAALYAQTFSPVLWSDSVTYMADDGVDAFLELGPGEVLSGLNKRIRKGLTQMAAGTPEALEAMAAALGASR